MVYAIEYIEENEMRMFRFSVFIMLVMMPQLVFGFVGGMKIHDAKLIFDENNKPFAEFLVTLSVIPLGDVVFKYSTADGTAKQGKDYVKTEGIATMSSQQIMSKIKVPLINKRNKIQKNFYMTISSKDTAVFLKKAEAKIEPLLLTETSKGETHETK
jgi:hypothetical protein